MHKKITIISSFYNEEKNISKFYEEVNLAIIFLKKHEIDVNEIILIDNNSLDNTFEELNKLEFHNTNILIFKNKKKIVIMEMGLPKGFWSQKLIMY